MAKKKEDGFQRKEIKLHTSITGLLQVGADRKGWSLKKFMEYTLQREAKKQIPYS